MSTDGTKTRRQFLRTTSLMASAFAFPTVIPARARGSADRIRIGMVGVKNQGSSNLKAFLGKKSAEVVALCDVDKDVLAAASALVEKNAGRKVSGYGDYRKLLESKDVDAVAVSTPDHWHALITCDACSAGKDVYCEKPLSLTVAEGQAMVKAARQYGRIVQTGSQQRSDDRFRTACELVRNGHLGKIKEVRVGLPGVNFNVKPVPDSAAPEVLDYEFWLGPAPYRPYNTNRVHYNFRFFWDYSGGQMTNWGAHHLDIAQWGLGRDDSGPVQIEGTATFQPDGLYEVPQTSRVVFTYDDGVRVICEQGTGDFRGGTTFVGSAGTLYVTRGKIESDPADILLQTASASDKVHLEVSKNHHENWLEGIRSRKLPICDVAVGHRSATVCHLANIAFRTGRTIKWDPAKEQIQGDPEAAAMLKRPYREPWKHPAV